MATIYRSKIGIEIIALLAAGMIPGFITTLADDKNNDPEVPWILGGIFILIFGLMMSTRYKIDGNMLRIYVLVFPYRPIDITTITQIEETNNPLSAPATSLDRLGIKHGKGYMLVSPKDKHGFIAALQQINPDIVFKSSK
jgi:hypothetical protein